MPAAAKATQVSRIVFPRIPIQSRSVFKGSYRSFLRAIINNRSNSKPFAISDKTTIDVEYQRQLQGLIDDESSVQRIMKEEARSPQSIEHFTQLQQALLKHKKPFAVDEDVRTLNFPDLLNHPKNRQYDICERQTYLDFAKKAEKKNPGFSFTKAKMDQAFEWVCKQSGARVASKGKTGHADFEKMMARCLGKESKEYWQGR